MDQESLPLSSGQPGLVSRQSRRVRVSILGVHLLLLACWWGGLTFYAAVVVPEGSNVVGAFEQGLITQRVTGFLNGLGVLTAVSWIFADAFFAESTVVPIPRSRFAQVRRRWLFIVFVVIQAGLFLVHRLLDQRLGGAVDAVPDYRQFYAVHRVYLLLTSGHWLVGGLQLVRIARRLCT